MSNKKIALIVEESKTIQLYYKNLIVSLGYKVLTATSLSQIKALTDNKIDIALVSLNINNNVESIVDNLISKDIAVILLSVNDDIKLKEKLVKKDIVDYIENVSTLNSVEIVKIINRLNTNIKETILVVDDSSLYRKLIKDLLFRHRFNVIEASDGQEALEVLKKNKDIKLIITDYEMPKLDGLGLIKEVRKLYNIQELPIIVISSLDSKSTVVNCMKNGANDYLHKPFSNGEFFARLYLTLSYKENIDLLAEQKEAYESLSHSLEIRVFEELHKNQQQTSHMLQQSRLAQMGEMISMIAHQWRQPLASISAISSTLTLDIMMNEYKAEFFQERLNSINELSQHLSSTIDDFRNFFKNDKNQQNAKLRDIINGSLQIIGPTLKTKSISFDVNCDDDILVYTYVNEVKQVIINILKNAEDILIEKESSDAKIWIHGYIEDGYSKLSIEDNAGGIPEEYIMNVFDPYFSTKHAKDGTGLGLYMSKTIIEDHCKGKLSVTNSEKGAKFLISILSKIEQGSVL